MRLNEKQVDALCTEICDAPVMEFHTNPETASKAFKLLEHMLDGRMLPMHDWPGPRVPGRPVNVGEFMYMQAVPKPGIVILRFKHIATRNYVEVYVNGFLGARLVVPRTAKAFFRGGFGPLPEHIQEREKEAVTC